MITKNEVSNIPYSFEEVDQLGFQTCGLLQRDAVEFSSFGIDQQKADEYKALSDSFNKRDFDEEFLIIQKEKRQMKDTIAEEIRIEIYNLSLKVNLVMELSGENFSSLRLGAISQTNDYELATKAKVYASILTKRIADFSEVGVTVEMLDDLSIKVDNFRMAIDEFVIAVQNRHMAQSSRIVLANKLHAETIKYRTLGRKMWAVTDYERSQSYVMPKKYSGSAGADPLPIESPTNQQVGETA